MKEQSYLTIRPTDDGRSRVFLTGPHFGTVRVADFDTHSEAVDFALRHPGYAGSIPREVA